MEDSKSEIIHRIADNLNCGENCYYNPTTNEIITIPQSLEIYEDEEFMEFFQENIDKVAENKTDFIKIEVLESSASFKIMEKFVDKITDKKFRNKLEEISQERKPFKNFKYQVENSDYREDWFEFRQKETEKIVVEILDSEKTGNY